MSDQRDLGVVDEGVVDEGKMESAFGSIDDVACVCRIAPRCRCVAIEP